MKKKQIMCSITNIPERTVGSSATKLPELTCLRICCPWKWLLRDLWNTKIYVIYLTSIPYGFMATFIVWKQLTDNALEDTWYSWLVIPESSEDLSSWTWSKWKHSAIPSTRIGAAPGSNPQNVHHSIYNDPAYKCLMALTISGVSYVPIHTLSVWSCLYLEPVLQLTISGWSGQNNIFMVIINFAQKNRADLTTYTLNAW